MADTVHDLKIVEGETSKFDQIRVNIFFVVQKVVHDSKNSHKQDTRSSGAKKGLKIASESQKDKEESKNNRALLNGLGLALNLLDCKLL